MAAHMVTTMMAKARQPTAVALAKLRLAPVRTMAKGMARRTQSFAPWRILMPEWQKIGGEGSEEDGEDRGADRAAGADAERGEGEIVDGVGQRGDADGGEVSGPEGLGGELVLRLGRAALDSGEIDASLHRAKGGQGLLAQFKAGGQDYRLPYADRFRLSRLPGLFTKRQVGNLPHSQAEPQWKKPLPVVAARCRAYVKLESGYWVMPAFFRSPALKIEIDDGSMRFFRAAEISAGVRAAILASIAASRAMVRLYCAF